MSPQFSPSWMSNPPWAAQYTRRRGAANPNLRVSDAERADVADKLSKHYGDGRLDQAEFNERMERAMSAKTHGDFAGLFADLPDLPDGAEPGASPPANVTRSPSRSPMYRLFVLILIVVAAALLGQALIHSFFPWLLLVAVVAFLWLRNSARRRHHT
jgi:Flp pilus assembly protein TadB